MDDRNQHTVLKTHNLSIGYARSRDGAQIVADAIDVHVQPGEMVCLLGPNGAGKSTLIKTLAGMQPALDGEVELFGTSLLDLHPTERARKLSTVLTDPVTVGNIDVGTLVAFGRSPYTGWMGRLTDTDEQIVRQAIEWMGLQPLAYRDISTLSDGERQKAMIARALAQQTGCILLDEPTAHLDLPNRVDIIRLLRRLAAEDGKAILLSTHELDLALRAADTVWLMDRGCGLKAGTPEDLVLDGTFEEAFNREHFTFDRATGSFTLHTRTKAELTVSGDAVGCFWTRRALEREGYGLAREGASSRWEVRVHRAGAGYGWQVMDRQQMVAECHSIRELIEALKKHR